MIAVIQRVATAAVEINSQVKGKIGKGLLVLVGIEEADDANA
jgi:D-tyrosyl-tRNA(Tyr) deacylase